MSRIEILEDLILYRNPKVHAAFPSITKLSNGDLLCVFKVGSGHASEDGRIKLMRSKDSGKTWIEAKEIINTEFDDKPYAYQNAWIMKTSKNVVIVNYHRFDCSDAQKMTEGEEALVNPRTEGFVNCEIFVVRSFDNGYTWEKPIEIPTTPEEQYPTKDAIVEAKDGTLLYPLMSWKEYDDIKFKNQRAFTLRSHDDGKTWIEESIIAHDPSGDLRFEEPGLVVLPDGRIIAMMRTWSSKKKKIVSLYQSISKDNGISWSEPAKTNIWGYPAHLLLLKNGDILCTYGYRKKPLGVRGVLSYDNGKTWDVENEFILRDDGVDWDLGYPSSVQLEDSTVFTAYYFNDPDGTKYIRGCTYSLG